MDKIIEDKQPSCDKLVPQGSQTSAKRPKIQASRSSKIIWQKQRLFNLVLICIFVMIFDWTLVVMTLRNKFGSFTVINAKPCQNALGQMGTCMFMWDCIKSEGLHLGTCSDRFLFGSCCYHNITTNDVDLQKTTSTTNNADTTYSNRLKPQEPASNATSDSYALSTQSSSQSQTTSILSNNLDSIDVSQKVDLPYVMRNQSNIANSLNENFDQPKKNDSFILTWHKSPSNTPTITDHHNWPSSEQQGFTMHDHTTNQEQVYKLPTLTGLANEQSTSPHKLQSNQLSTANPVVPQTSSSMTSSTTSQPLVSDKFPDRLPSSPFSRPAPLNVPIMQNQPAPLTQRPQTSSSLLSRPASMLANAIFHSFKPFSYLHSNKQRPTYRPSFGGYKPAIHHRPAAMNLQRPSFFNLRPHNQQIEQINYQNDSKVPASVSILASNSSSYIHDNNDHHVVNPFMSDRTRPKDKTQIYDTNIGQKQNQYEIFDNTNGSSLQQLNENKGSQSQSTATQYETPNLVQSTHSSPSTEHQQVTDTNSTYIYHTSSTDPTESLNNATTNLGISNSAPNSLGYIQSNTNYDQTSGMKPVISMEQSIVHSPSNDSSLALTNSYSTLNVGYQSIQNSHNDIPQSSIIMSSSQSHTMSPIDEIHGLSVSTFDSSSSNNITGENNGVKPGLSGNNQLSNNITSNSENLVASSSTSPSEQGQINSNVISTTQGSTGSITLIGNDQTPSVTSEPIIANNNAPTISATALPSTTTTTTTPSNVTTSSSTQTSSSAPSYHQNHHVAASTPPRVTTSNSYSNLETNKKHGRDATCGITTLYPQTKVVGGKNAAFGAWPWQVSVRKTSLFGFTTTHRCGGAVISNEWIATAGHCVEDLPVQSIRLRVGEHDFSSTTEPFPAIERAARRKVVHPKYNVNTYENDLALVQLDRPIQFPPHVAPICLPPDDIDLLGKNATLTGWGRLNEGGLLPTILQEVRVPIVSNDECKDMFLRAGRQEYIPDIFLCAGYEEGGRDSCQGDSGGPLQVKGDDGKWFLAGIISWGIGCAEQNLPGVCTRISHFKLWIQSTIDSHS